MPLEARSFFSSLYVELDGGFNMPQAAYDKYVDPGFSLRTTVSYTDPDFPMLHYDVGFQYLQFRRDDWWEFDPITGMSIQVTNSEQSYNLSIGPRITSPTTKGALRPYVGVKGGIFLFTETIKWDWSENDNFWCWFWDSCDEDSDNSYTELLDARVHFGWIVELGTNLYLHRHGGLDIGVQYTMIPGIHRSEIIFDEDYEHISSISRRLNATYLSFYLGASFPIGLD